MDKKIDLIAKLFITYIFILALCFLVYSLVVLPTSGAEKVNAIIGLLGWSATIYAPIAAFFLLHNWREQVFHERSFDALTTAYTLIGKIHSSVIKLKMDSYYPQIQRAFRNMTQVEFEEYMNRLRGEFENKSSYLKEQYDGLNTALAIYKLIKPSSKIDLDFVLDSYFKISYRMIDIYSDVINIYLEAKTKEDSYEFLVNHHLYETRMLQIRKRNHPDDGKNQDGSFLFFTTEYLVDIRNNCQIIMQNAFKELQ